ncbi:MAG: phosphogluconate dehydrogenase (NAD(+)-dependent, decarboxylating) [Desulfurivibrionaceae bacterium]
MKIGMVGLGRMGMNMARRLLQGGCEVVVFNRTFGRAESLAREGAEPARSLEELLEKLPSPGIVWLMLPAGEVVDEYLGHLKSLMPEGGIVIDGANSNFRDDKKRVDLLAESGIHYLDVGVSGGVWGLEEGYCLMVGGEKKVFLETEPILKVLAPPEGYLYCGPTGAGHFVKMVHNGIEYGMMGAYAEGFSLLESSEYRDHLDFARVSRLWNRGSVIRSWLLELLEDAFSEDPGLTELFGYVDDSGEGRWTVQEAVEKGVPVPVISSSLFQRFSSRGQADFANRVLAALRREFGGHPVVSNDET